MDKSERNYGIDLLRIVAILMITIHHVILHGSLLLSKIYINYEISQFINVLVYCGVNCFGLISGYVLYNNNIKYERIFYLYIQVLFYSLGAFFISSLINPEFFNVQNFLFSFFPFIKGNYWYFTAYFGIFFFIPFLNKLIESIDLNSAKILFLKLFIIFSVLPTVFFYDLFQTKSGYSALWLLILYLFGALIKKINFSFNKNFLLVSYFILSVLNFGTIILVERFIKNDFFVNFKNIFMPYISPVMLLSAIILILIFSKTKIKNIFFQQTIKFLSPTIFGIYLFQETPLIKEILKGILIYNFKTLSSIYILIRIFSFAFIIFVFGVIIEKIRICIFRSVTFLIKKFCKTKIKNVNVGLSNSKTKH